MADNGTTSLVMLFLFVTSLQVVFGVTNSQDASALKSLISQWQNLPLSWNESTDPCDNQWDVIQCSKGRVTSLSLPGMNIKGKISVDICLLTELTILDLASNPDLNCWLAARKHWPTTKAYKPLTTRLQLDWHHTDYNREFEKFNLFGP
ncbi:leucine-rich repeat receptor protein kinase HPCA1-like isoform X2 [Carex rostrata]